MALVCWRGVYLCMVPSTMNSEVNGLTGATPVVPVIPEPPLVPVLVPAPIPLPAPVRGTDDDNDGCRYGGGGSGGGGNGGNPREEEGWMGRNDTASAGGADDDVMSFPLPLLLLVPSPCWLFPGCLLLLLLFLSVGLLPVSLLRPPPSPLPSSWGGDSLLVVVGRVLQGVRCFERIY